MKTTIRSIGFAALFISSLGFAEQEINSLVEGEFQKAQSEIRTEYVNAARRTNSLQSARLKAAEEMRRRAEHAKVGAELMAKYSTLLNARYRNDLSQFEGGLELGAREVDQINKVFQKYLSSIPLQGRISAGEGKRVLAWGQKRLLELSASYSAPTEGNSSELELIAYQTKLAEGALKRIGDLAKAMGIDVTTALAENAPAAATERTPASK